MNSAGRTQGLAVRAPVLILLFVEREVAAREGSIIPFSLLPDRDVRGDAGTNEPSKDAASGSLSFSDADLSDTHSVSSSGPTFSWTNAYGKTLSASQINGLTAASTFALTLHESTGTGHGSGDFSYSAEDLYFDFLAVDPSTAPRDDGPESILLCASVSLW